MEENAQRKDAKAWNVARYLKPGGSTIVFLFGLLGVIPNIIFFSPFFLLSALSDASPTITGYFVMDLIIGILYFALSLLAALGVIVVRTKPQKGARFMLIPGVLLLTIIIMLFLFDAMRMAIDFIPDYEGQTPLDKFMEEIPIIIFSTASQLLLIMAGLIARRRTA